MASGSGLDGVIAAETTLSDVDGERGRLILAGHDVEELAAQRVLRRGVRAVFSAVAAPRRRGGARRARARPRFERLPRLGDALDAPDGMDALRAALAHLRRPATTPPTRSPRSARCAGVRRRVGRARRGDGADRARSRALDHAADYLRMIARRDAVAGDGRRRSTRTSSP